MDSLIEKNMPATTPIARSKSAALARILDAIPRGYHSYTYGNVVAAKAIPLAKKFHHLYGIGLAPAQRLRRKQRGCASALLVMYWPEGADVVEWMLLVTSGTGLDERQLKRFDEKPRLQFLGYEMTRHLTSAKTSWTWRRPKAQMEELHTLIAHQAGSGHYAALASTLERIVRQPGFHGVYKQSGELLLAARRRGFSGKLPKRLYMRKISHGDRIIVTS